MGPAFDVLQALEFIDDQRPIYISYCDYYMHWDYEGFHKKVQSKKYDGWKEPKIAVSFLNNSHIYYGAVWSMILVFLLFVKS